MRTLRSVAVAIVSAAFLLGGLVSARADVVGWGGRDVTFTPPVLSGPVNTIIQLKIGANAGKYLIGGSFTDAGGNTAIDYVARLNADGTIDTGFIPPTFSAGQTSCELGDGTNGPTIDVRTLLETQVTSGSNTAGKIYIGGNFTAAGGVSKMDYLIRVNANGGSPNTSFYPTDTGLSTGAVSYTNCVKTIFTGEGSGNTLALVVGSTANGRLTKKVYDSGANYAGFTQPSLSAAVNTGFFCPAGTCGANRYIIGGNFTNAGGNTNMTRLAKIATGGGVDTGGGYPTTDGTLSGTPLFDARVNSIALDTTVSPAMVIVGGSFTGQLQKLGASDFLVDPDFVAPVSGTGSELDGDVWSVAVDPVNPDDPLGGTQSYLFSGGFTDAGDVPQCDYVCSADYDGAVSYYFPAPPPDADVRVATVNTFGDDNVGKYMIGGDFTDLGGNTSTDQIARLNQATPDSITINSDGGNDAGGTDGIRTLYSNGQWQVYREGAGQLYLPFSDPPFRDQYNQIALALTDEFGGGFIIGPSTTDMGEQNWNTNDRLYRQWDSVTATGGSTGTGTGASELSVEVDGRTYVVNMDLDYTFPDNHIRQTFTVDIPAGNTYNVKLYNLYDSYLGGSDQGPGFYNAASGIVGVAGQTVYEGLRYVSGQDWDGYMSAYYNDVVFSGGGVGAGFGTDLDNSIVTDPTNDNGFGVNWDFGSAAGTTAPVVTDFIFGSFTAPTAAPTSAAGEVKVDWTDPSGITPAPDSYVVTAYDNNGDPTANTCTATAPTMTCTVTGLDPAIAYTFLVEFLESGSTVFNAGSTAVHAKREVTLKIWGDPLSVGPAVTFSRTLGTDPDAYMAPYTGLTAANEAVPTVTPECPSGTITSAEATATGQPGEYTAVLGCEDGLDDITSYTTKITVGAGSCLIAAGLPAAGTYNVGTSQQSIPTYGTNLPDGTTPAYQAIKDTTPLTDFGPTATAGIYLPATRACIPSSAPSTASTATVAGAIPMTVTAPISNGGSAEFEEPDLGAVNGFNRILAEPTNTTGTGGGYRSGYYRCGVTNASGVSVPCQLGGPAGVKVTTGGVGGRWNPAGCNGQTIGFRSRYMTQMGYGLWSDIGNKVLTGGCS